MFLSRAEMVRIVSVARVWSAAIKQAPAALINEVLSPSWDEMKSLYLATLSTLVLRLFMSSSLAVRITVVVTQSCANLKFKILCPSKIARIVVACSPLTIDWKDWKNLCQSRSSELLV